MKNKSTLFIKDYLEELKKIAEKIDIHKIEKIVNIISNTQKKSGRIFFIGVGGSAANTSHAVNDFRKIAAIECYAPMDNVSEISARTNDNGWNSIFSEWLKISKINKKDILFIFSVGGGDIKNNISTNIIEAIDYAKKTKAKIIGIVG
jgi:D-sedoheptulose 7-phosphate isomerase